MGIHLPSTLQYLSLSGICHNIYFIRVYPFFFLANLPLYIFKIHEYHQAGNKSLIHTIVDTPIIQLKTELVLLLRHVCSKSIKKSPIIENSTMIQKSPMIPKSPKIEVTHNSKVTHYSKVTNNFDIRSQKSPIILYEKSKVTHNS